MEINNQDTEIILQSRKSYLVKDGEYWAKKQNEDFDVPVGAFDGAEVADIVGLFMLSELEKQKMKAIWTSYKDDGLAISDAKPQEVERMKKKVCKIFRDNGLEITADANKKVVQFLDVECTRLPWTRLVITTS